MLFTGSAAKPKRDEKKEKKSDRDERYDIQEGVFVRWGNSLLANEPLTNFRDLADFKYISMVVHVATGNPMTMSGSRYEDAVAILNAINDNKIAPHELADSNQKAVMATWWGLIQAFWKRFGPDPICEEKLTEAIKQWCLEVTKGYDAVSVSDFTSSWRDGYAFNCLLHSFDKNLVDLELVAQSTATDRLEHAFATAEREFKVARLLHVKDLQSEHLDAHSVVCYLMTLYLSLLGKSSIGTFQNVDPSTASPQESAPSPQYTEAVPTASEDTKAVPVAVAPAIHAQASVEQPQEHVARPEGLPAEVSPAQQPQPQPQPAQPQLQPQVVQPQPQPQPQVQAPPQPHPQTLQPPTQCSTIPSTSSTLSAPDSAPRAKKPHLQTSAEHSTETEQVRSRKSSSSSQKSSKSRRARKEEMTREFENCLEQVLTWLLEAEEELSLLDDVDESDLKVVRKQFKDFENFMSSLTESQDTVGRVLHRGQILCGKSETEEERQAIEGQLRVVNGRWEELRELAMQRQNALQLILNRLQNQELANIEKWLSGVEFEMTSCEPLADNEEAALRQIEAHTNLQAKIHAFQDTINDLSSFVAVVDEGESSDERIGALEQRLQFIGERWRTVCEWAEVRASHLDGLAELCGHTAEVFSRLSDWLKGREHELLGLKSAHHLEDPEQISEQVKMLQNAEAALEAEHSSFVRLSQLSCELVARLDKGNGAAANAVRRQLDTVTQRWDNLVARIEEHSRMLVQSGKADVRQFASPLTAGPSTIEQNIKADRVVKPNESSMKIKSLEEHAADPGSSGTTDTDTDEVGNQLVERFLKHVDKMTTEMEPLQAWTTTFSVSKKPDQVRRMISICQEKLMEIKDQEAKVNRLQLELEHMHLSDDLTAAQLKLANDAFEKFAKGWARIVTKISEAMNVLTGHDESDEEHVVAKGIEQWIEGCDKVLTELARATKDEREKRLAKLQQQLETQQTNLSFIEKDPLKKAILKKGLDIVKKRIDGLSEEPSTSKLESALNAELEGEWCTVGDVAALDKEVERAEKAVQTARNSNMGSEMVEKAETRRAEMMERRRATLAALQKMKSAEEGIKSIAASVEATSSSDISLSGTIVELKHARARLASYENLKKEAERAAEKMLALDDNVPQSITQSTRNRIRELGDRWRELENTIEDHLSCARKEQKRSVQKSISNEERLLEELEKRLADSEKASDAEECCEHLDNLENLLEKVNQSMDVDEEILSMEESYVRDSLARLNQSRQRLADATRERIAALSRAVADCERFEKQMADIQQWSANVSTLLDLRKSSDVSALDVPDEYKSAYESGTLVQELSREFANWSTALDETAAWLEEGERKDNERFHDQFAHAKNTFADLSQKFADFKHPKAFEEKLERIVHKLGDLENSLDDMTGIEAIFCADALTEAKSVVKKLITIEEDLQSLEKGKEQLIQEGIFDKESAAPFTEKLRHSKKKTKELGVRAEDAVERLEDCVEMYEKLLKESEKVEEFLDQLEDRLEKYASEDKSNDEEVVNELISEWNRHESSMKNLEELERLLRENAVKVSEAVCADKRRRADALKIRLDGWSRTVQEMDNDEDTLLMQVDELHTYLVNELDKVKDKKPEEIASALRFLRGDRDRLSSRARKLAAINPRVANANLCGEVADRWSQLESQLHAPEKLTSELGGVHLNPDLPFHQKIDLLKESFDKARDSLDFDRAPVSNVKQWEQRVKAVDEFLADSRSALEEVIDKGRSLANSGRMELDTHRAIEKLDDIVDVADQLEMEVESQKSLVDPLLAQAEALERDVEAAENVVDALISRNLTDPAIAKATRQDLADRDAQFAALSQRAAAIHAELPGKSSASRDTTLSTLGDKLSRLESMLIQLRGTPSRSIADATPIKTSPDRTSASSMGPLAMEVGNVTDAYMTEDEGMRDEGSASPSKNAPVPSPRDGSPRKSPLQEDTSKTAFNLGSSSENGSASPPKAKMRKVIVPKESKERKSAGPPVKEEPKEEVTEVTIGDVGDVSEAEPTVSVTFTQPNTVKMAVETNGDGDHSEDVSAAELPPSGPLPSPDGKEEMEKVYTNLDAIEEAIASDEQYPMEGIDNMEERYKRMANELEDALKKIDEHQMTMDMLHVSHTQDRVHALQKDLAERQERALEERKEWQTLQHVLFEAEKGVAMGDNAMDRFTGRQTSPPLQELEERQNAVEELLPRTEALVCDAVRRLSTILPRMRENSERARAIRNRVRDVEMRFRDLVRAAREARVRLDARAVDQGALKQGLENLQFWCDETATELEVDFNPFDAKAIDEAVRLATIKNAQIPEKKAALIALEAAKERLIAMASVDNAEKHEVRRGVSEVAKRIADIRSDLADRLQALNKQKRDCESFWRLVDDIAKRGSDLRRRCQAINDAVIFTPSPDHVLACHTDARNLKEDVAMIKERVREANAEHPKLTGKNEKKLITVITTCNNAISEASSLPEPQPTTDDSMRDSSHSQSTVVDATRGELKAPSSSNTTAEMIDDDGELTDEDTVEPEYQGRLESTASSTKDDDKRDPSMPKLNARDAANWQSLTQLRHWLNELERDASLTVDLVNTAAIKEMNNTVQGIMDHIRMKIMDVVGIQDASAASLVKLKARELVEDMDRVAKQCDRRRTTLTQMAEQSRAWNNAHDAVEIWMQDADSIIGHKRTEESSDAVMREELTAIENLINVLEQKKEAIKDVNAKGNAMLDTYKRDEAHNLSHELSKLNMRWSKFNDNLRIRRAVLEATLRSRTDFSTAFTEFEEWLGKIAASLGELETLTENTQSLKDTGKRREWIQKQKELETELDAHESVLRSVEEMGRKLGAGLESGKERAEIQNRLEAVSQRWKDIRNTEASVRKRLAEAEQEWERLTNTLSSLIGWIEDKSKEMLAQQPVGGSLSSVMAQGAYMKNTEKEMEVKSIQVRDAITNAHSFLMQHDLRPKMHKTGVLAEDDDEAVDAEQRRCGLQIHADCEKLKEKWAELNAQFTDWDNAVHAAAVRLQELERALAECQLHLSSVESEVEHLHPVERLRLEELKDARRQCELLATRVNDLRIHVDDANDACGRVLAADTPLDQHPRNQLDSVNQRFVALKTALRVRSAALRNALTDFGPSSEHFLNQSVVLPWQRAISKTNQLPYYIDHTTEKTQWEHPVWVEMSKELSQFNRVKFIAYRTAMKLRALQKRLCLDLVDIPMLEKCFSRLAGLSNEESPGLEGMVSSLLPLFEQLHQKHPQMVRSVALAVDLCINFLLNLFDPSRDGLLRVLSFKIALVVFSNAPLEDKYRFLFNLVAQDGQADQKHVALLLYDLIQIPKLVGEAAAFGGSNVEPSVRSCFETVRLSSSISIAPFLEWLKQEPQSVVWLPVMHRLATAEFAKHQAKCNVCKMFPIVGLRYRCLRCFNLDLCQNCFFSQRTAKKHKLKHPMQEYAVPTTSSEDARDFARMVKNKFSRSKSSLGYLPVDVGDEGRPLAAPPAAARNPATEALHQRSAAISHRLAQLTASQPAEPRDERLADIQSPAQLISQVEQMQKDELDQVLQRLQLENMELKRELERRKAATTSTPDLDRTISPTRRDTRGATLPRLSGQANYVRSVPSLKSAQSQSDVMDEARALRLHKQRLEHRSRILEQQNEQLELQLQRLKKVIEQQKENGSRAEWSAERDWAERRSHPPYHSSHEENGLYDSSARSRASERAGWDEDDGLGHDSSRGTRMQSLLATVDDLGRAMENLVVSVVYDSDQEQ